MELLIGKEELSESSIIDTSEDWKIYAGEICISWRKVWDLESTLNFGNDYIETFAGGKDGTLIARYRKQEYSYTFDKKTIEIYNYKGIRLYEYQISNDKKNIFFHVTKEDKLFVVTTDGCLLTFFAGREVSKIQIVDHEVNIYRAVFWDDGFVYITDEMDLYYVEFPEKPKFLHCIKSEMQTIDKMKIIPPSGSEPLTVIFTDGSQKVLFVNESGIKPYVINEDYTISNFSINANCTNIAFICNSSTSHMIVVTTVTPFEPVVRSFLEEREEPLLQLSWLGSVVPIITYENSVNILCRDFKIYEMSKERYPFSGCSWVFPSTNYALVFSSGALFVLKEVSGELIESLRRDNKSNSINLVDAFLNRSSKKALMMKDEGTLSSAINNSVSAAFEIDSPQVQQLLMFAANFGRTYLGLSENNQSFTEHIQKLRICNSFAKELNVFISPPVLNDDIITYRDILYRICNQKRYSLALKIADYLLSEKRFIVTEWCLSMAYENQDDDTAFQFIVSKYNKTPELFEINAIATSLAKEGRLNLAKNVAGLEKATMNIVPFFVSRGMWKEALTAAKNSYDSSLFIECFNKAIDSKLDDTAIDIVKNDKIMFSTISKLIPQDEQVILRIREMRENNDISRRNKAYLRLIEENAVALTSQNVINYVQSLKNEESEFLKDWGHPLNGKTVNQALEDIILNIDYSSVNNIIDFVKKCSHPSILMFAMHSQSDKYYIMVATVLAKHNRWSDFKKLADNAFKSYYINYVMIAYHTFGKDHAREFIQNIHDAGRAKKLEDFFNCDYSPNSNYTEKDRFIDFLGKGKSLSLF